MSERKRNDVLTSLYDLATGDEDARVCKDIPDSQCRHLPRNFLAHLVALVATKTGDRLAGPKLVLAWMLSSLGAPAYLVSMLVPIREALALLPQLVVAAVMRRAPIRKWFWVGGSAVQGLCVAAMGLAAMALRGPALGWTVVGLLVLFSLARGVCSIAAKDVMGKTVSKTRRGTLTGYAASAAGLLTVGVAALIAVARSGEAPGAGFFGALLIGAGLLWLFAATAYARVQEYPGATEGGGNAGREALANIPLLWRDATLRHFVITRALLVSTALSAPFLVLLANRHGDQNSALGLALMLAANGVAAWASAPLWGRMADRSSRRVLVAAAAAASVLGFAVFGFAQAGSPWRPDWVYTGAFFVLAVIHTGVRIGRKTYLVDMADADSRATYVALSNTAIGVVLLGGGAIGAVAEVLGIPAAIATLAVLAGAGAVSAQRLKEVQ